MPEITDLNKQHLAVIFALLGVIEVAIMLVCWVASWDKSYVAVENSSGDIVYETSFLTAANQLDKAKAIIEINNNMEGATPYRLISKEITRSFPIVAWISASIAIPLAVIFLGAFVVRTYKEIVSEKDTDPSATHEMALPGAEQGFEKSRLENTFIRFSRLNIFALGGVIFVIAVLFWWIPDFVMGIGKYGITLVQEHPWVLYGLFGLTAIMLIINSVMKHRVSMEIIKQQADIQRKRDAYAMELKKHELLNLKRNGDNRSLVKEQDHRLVNKDQKM